MTNSNVPATVHPEIITSPNFPDIRTLTGLSNLNDNELICISFISIWLDADNDEKSYCGNFLMSVKDVIFTHAIIDDAKKSGISIYYTPCTFFDISKGRKQSNIQEIKEIVFDIDYGTTGHKTANNFSSNADALDWINKNLPKATRLICTGGGYQVHYMLSVSPDNKKYIDAYNKISQYLNKDLPLPVIDSCSSPEHLFRLPLSYNTKLPNNPRYVDVIESNDVEYSIDELLNIIVPANYIYVQPAPVVFYDDEHKAEYTKEQKQIKSNRAVMKTFDRSRIFYGIICRMLSATGHLISNRTLTAMIKKRKKIYSHFKDERHLLKDIEHIRLKHKAQLIKPVLPVETIDIKSGYDISHLNSMRNKFKAIPQGFDTMDNGNKFKFNTVLSCLDYIISDKNRNSGILSVPCASSKSYSSLITIAHRASPERRIWYVSSAIKDCKRSAEILKSMGINAVAFHGRIEENCPERNNRNFWQNKKSLCSACQNKCGAELKYCQDEKYDYISADVVCCTHRNLLNALEMQAIPQLDLIVIDESPNILESFSFTHAELQIFYDLLGQDEIKKTLFESDILDIKNILHDDGAHLIKPMQLINYSDDILKYMFVQYNKGFLTEIQRDFVIRFFNFFKRGKIYGFKTTHETTQYNDIGKIEKIYTDTYKFMSSAVNLNSGCQTIILDGSARNQSVKWNNFKIYDCPQLKVRYPNTTVSCISQNPTQTRLSKPEIFQTLSDEALMNMKAGDTVLTFTHKDMSNKSAMLRNYNQMKTEITAKGANIKELTRSQNVGSNEGRNCINTVISMALFTDAADYILRACVFNDCEISHAEIWKNKSLWFEKNNGWHNPLIQEQYVRTLERDLYQAIMRGCIRDNPQAEYTVTALISNPEVLATLADDLPDAKFTLANEIVIEMLQQGFTESEIIKATGKAQQTVNNEIKAYRKLGLKDDDI